MLKMVGAKVMLAWLLALCALSAHGQSPAPNELRVGIKSAPPFAMADPQNQWQGVSVDLWQQIASDQGWQTRWQRFDSADSLIDALAAGEIDIAVGALSMTAEREAVMDFSHPFFTTGLGIATPVGKKGIMASLSQLASWEFLRAVGLLFALLLAVGAVLWLLERRRNADQFGGSASQGIGNGLWWSAVTMTTVGYGDKAPVTLPGRIVATVWMFVSVITISSFTAAIASSVTVNQIATSVNGVEDLAKIRSIAVAGSTGAQALQERGFALSAVDSPELGIAAVQNGAPAMVYDKAIMMYLLRDDTAGIDILDFPGDPQKYALGMRPDFPHREAVNHALLEVTRGAYWQGQLRRYFGEHRGYQGAYSPQNPNSLRANAMPRAALLFASCIVALSATAAPANQAREVVTAMPQRLSGQQQLSLTGSVVSLQQAQVSARSDGLVAEILADTGATVTRGQALLRLDAELAKLDRDRAAAARNEALAARNEARRLVQEAERLRKNNHVSENEVKSRRAALALAEASFAATEASLASSREALARHTLPAPFDGVVSDRFTELGEWLNRGDPVFEVVSLNELRVDVQIPQERFGDIDVNTPVSICSDALAQPCIEGRVATQVPVSDPVSRTFLIRVAPVDRDQNLLPGTSAQVHFAIGSTQRSEYLTPRQAVLRHPDGSRSLFVVKDGRAQRRLITVSREVEKGLIITEGLSPEAVIIVQGADLLSDGDPVSAASAEER